VEKIIDSNWYYSYLQFKVKYKGYKKEHDEWLFRDNLLEDLGEESLGDYEKEFYEEHPKAPHHQDKNRVRKGVTHSFKKKKKSGRC